jgi:2-aminoadipate transaminase
MRPGFSRRADDVMQSYIMQLVAVANRPGMISFATGLPDNRLFDLEGLKRAADDVLSGGHSADALQYGLTDGLPSLREKIAARCKRELGVDATADDVFITNGSQECFDHLGKLFLDVGDRMIVENPGYLGALQSFSVYAPEFVGVDMDETGPDASQFEAAMATKPKMFYSIPCFQNPSGMSYSEDARKMVAESIAGSGCLLIEDDAYGELGYSGRPGRSMKSIAPEDTVLTGSFSKVISPGMRVGWMVVPEWMRDAVRTSVEAGALLPGQFCQSIIDRFLDTVDYDAYLDGLRAEYRRKKDVFLDLMEDELPDTMRWNDPAGGMFVWLRSPDGTDATRVYEEALRRNLVVMPGKPFHRRGGDNTIRLNFATPDDEAMKTGMAILGKACREAL